jgi:hypothetical protein
MANFFYQSDSYFSLKLRAVIAGNDGAAQVNATSGKRMAQRQKSARKETGRQA